MAAQSSPLENIRDREITAKRLFDAPRDADRLRKNPLGVYVNAINWSKEVGQ